MADGLLERVNMKRVRQGIVDRQVQFASHPFFERLARDEPFKHTMAFAAGATFFVMAFQDILRINESKIRDLKMLEIARHHRREDAGHDDWFVQDLKVLEGPELRDVRWLFGPTHATTRDTAYSLLSEVYRASDDRIRIVLLLVLEATGHVMFTLMSDYVERNAEPLPPLVYFSKKHLGVELGHELFDREVSAMLEEITLGPEQLEEALALVDRGFDTITAMFDGFEERIRRSILGSLSLPPSKREQSAKSEAFHHD